MYIGNSAAHALTRGFAVNIEAESSPVLGPTDTNGRCRLLGAAVAAMTESWSAVGVLQTMFPALVWIVWPVIWFAASLHRKRAVHATSSGSATWPVKFI